MSTESPATSYGSSKLYPLKGNSNLPGISGQTLSPDTRKIMCVSHPYGSESYSKYFYGSISEELSNSDNSLNPEAASASFSSMVAGDLLDASLVPRRHRADSESNSESTYLGRRNPDAADYGEDDMKLKLQELERALLDDNDAADFNENGNGHSMEVDGEWVDPNQEVLLHGTSKESSSMDSSLSSVSCTEDTSLLTSRRAPKQLLLDCAALLSEGKSGEASAIISQLRQMVSVLGDPRQRIDAYMVESLAARVAASGKCLYRALKCKEPPSSDRLAAMQILVEVCPCFRFGFMAANGAILEAAKDEKVLHIVDFDINQGTQYITLLQTLATQPSKPHLRLTGVDDPESVQRAVGGLKVTGMRLEQLAEILGVSFEFQAVASKTSIVSPSMLDCRPGEALVVNFAFQLHHLPDESVSTINLRDQLLRMVKSLNPKLVTVVEQDVNTNTAPFFPRFMEAYDYYSAVFESLDATLPRESQDRMNVERQCLARDIVNIVACEGEERIERYEVAGKWRARMTMAGFTSCPISPRVTDSIRKLIKEYCDRYKVKEERGVLHFGWEGKSLIVASAWR